MTRLTVIERDQRDSARERERWWKRNGPPLIIGAFWIVAAILFHFFG